MQNSHFMSYLFKNFKEGSHFLQYIFTYKFLAYIGVYNQLVSENLQHSNTEGEGTRGEGVGVWEVSDERRECYSKREVRKREVGTIPKIGSKITEGGFIEGVY